MSSQVGPRRRYAYVLVGMCVSETYFFTVFLSLSPFFSLLLLKKQHNKPPNRPILKRQNGKAL